MPSCWRSAPGGLVGGTAAGADAADETLGEHGLERGGDEEGLHSHVHEAGDRAGGVIGVQGGEHEVTRKRGLDGNLGGLQVADLAHHDDVGVLAEEGAEGGGEGEADGVVDRHLHDALDLVFDGVLGGEELHVGRVHDAQRRV